METSPRLDASRPSSLRLVSFVAIAAGALIMGVGSLLTWVTVGFKDQLSIQTVSPGTDLSAGIITLVSAVVILVLVLVSRFVADGVRRVIAVVIIAAGALSSGLAAWFIIAAPDHYSPVEDESLVNELAQVLGKSVDEVRNALASVIEQLGGYTHVGPGPWVAIVGGVLVIAGGVLTLRWAMREKQPTEPSPEGDPDPAAA
jgi:hypothetical protein